MFYLYILRNPHNKLYIGQTNNLPRRLQDHKNSSGAKYVRDHGDFKLVYSESFPSRIEGMHREKQLKKWSRAKKEALIAGNFDLLNKL